ncbi:hypothetical protein Vadar_021169 [Vaccinium darrowii]|uniref:Uncharacterized protein n=1 Tax=Vaccinium darrowii TaxID=229202 RepID=A0ACB7X2R1_9ERIC|nr:hypothetical protein Vadar_021169 [Vaccinium darrowii]
MSFDGPNAPKDALQYHRKSGLAATNPGTFSREDRRRTGVRNRKIRAFGQTSTNDGRWIAGTSVAGDVEPRADGAVRPYAERIRDCYVSACFWAAGLGDEEGGVGYSGDVGGYVCCSCGLCS